MIDVVVAYLPHSTLVLLFFLLDIAKFENQRWTRARIAGLQGSSEVAGLVVDITGLVASIFYWSFLVSYGFDASIWHVVTLFVAAKILTFLIGTAYTLIFSLDLIIWMISTLAIYPLIVILSFHVSWFGLFS